MGTLVAAIRIFFPFFDTVVAEQLFTVLALSWLSNEVQANEAVEVVLNCVFGLEVLCGAEPAQKLGLEIVRLLDQSLLLAIVVGRHECHELFAEALRVVLELVVAEVEFLLGGGARSAVRPASEQLGRDAVHDQVIERALSPSLRVRVDCAKHVWCGVGLGFTHGSCQLKSRRNIQRIGDLANECSGLL